MLAEARSEAELRSDDPSQASPGAGTVSSVAQFGTGSRAWILLAAAAAVAALILVGPDQGERTFVATVESYATQTRSGVLNGPTDRLLRVPGSELLGSVPSLDLPAPTFTEPGPSGSSPESRR